MRALRRGGVGLAPHEFWFLAAKSVFFGRGYETVLRPCPVKDCYNDNGD